MKTSRSTLDKDWIAPSSSLVLPCRWILALVALSRTDQPDHLDPSESDFLLHKLSQRNRTETFDSVKF